jgi:hypothetical protein
MADTPPYGGGNKRHRKNGHQWTDFEMSAVLALLCKGEHRNRGGAIHFATKLNKALNEGRYEDDLDIDDVADLL